MREQILKFNSFSFNNAKSKDKQNKKITEITANLTILILLTILAGGATNILLECVFPVGNVGKLVINGVAFKSLLSAI